MTTWSAIELDAPMTFTASHDCETVRLDGALHDFESSDPQPSSRNAVEMSWTWKGAAVLQPGPPTVVGTARNAGTIGNLLLAAIGAGVGLGFLPVAYEAHRSWRRARSREARGVPMASA